MHTVTVPLPSPLLPTTSARGSVVMTSLQGLEAKGLYHAYLERLPTRHHATLFGLSATAWLPIDFVVAHYLACDALPLTVADRIETGRYTCRRVYGGMMKLAVRLRREAGATPWTGLGRVEQFMRPLWIGGGLLVEQASAKDAYVSWRGQPCFQSQHFAHGWAGAMAALIELFAEKAYVRVERVEADGCVALARWV